MKTSILIQLTGEVEVKRGTPDDFDGAQQIALNYYPEGKTKGYTTVTLFAPTVAAGDALVDALVACGCKRGEPVQSLEV